MGGEQNTRGLRLAFVGKKGAGKSTGAVYLERKHKFKRKSLRDGVHGVLWKIYAYQRYYRIPWQTEWAFYDAMWELDHDIWTTYLEHRLRDTAYTRDVICEDVRYVNEVQKLKDMGFTIIRIVSPENTKRRNIKAQYLTTRPNGSLLLKEYFGDPSSAVAVSYVISNEDRYEFYKSLDDIVKLEREKLDNKE